MKVLSLSEGRSIEVLATSGDARLGGTDFDAAILEHVLSEVHIVSPDSYKVYTHLLGTLASSYPRTHSRTGQMKETH